MVTALEVYIAAQLAPQDLGTVAPLDGTQDAAVAYIGSDLLPLSQGEVDAQMLRASQGYTLPLPGSVLRARYPNYQQGNIDAYNTSAQELYDGAVKALCVAEVYSMIDSNSRLDDSRAEQHRKVGEEKLTKLMLLLSDLLIGAPRDTTIKTRIPVSMSVRTVHEHYGYGRRRCS